MTARWVSVSVVFIALLAGALAWMDAPLPLRAVPTALLVLFLPGLAIANALLPGTTIGQSERVLVAAGLSLAVDVAAGLVLNVTLGLNREALIVTLVAVAVLGSIVAFFKAPPKIAVSLRPGADRLPVHRLALFALGGLLAVAALALATFAQSNQPVAYFTELWAVPRAEFEQIEVGIRNMEEGPRTYRLEIRTGETLVREWPELPLPVSETWTETIDIVSIGQFEGDVTIRLYDTADPTTVYREAVVRKAVTGGF